MSDSIATMNLFASGPQTSTFIAQRPSRHTLMNCPPEVRQIIFKDLFDSTRLTFGYRQINYQYRKVLPSPTALAILRVCRQVYNEANGLWLSRVLFNFEDGMTLLDKLSSLPITTLGSIRHVRTRMLMDEPSVPGEIQEELVHGLQVLPGLNLDTLSIVSPWGFDRSEYFGCPDINRFLKDRFPCKELHLITPGSPFHTTASSFPGEASVAFGTHISLWASDLAQAGHAAPRVKIAVIQSTEHDSDRTGTVYNHSARQVLEETTVSRKAMKRKLVEFGKTLHPTAETLIIFKDVSAPPTTMTGTNEVEDIYWDRPVQRNWRGDVREEYLLDREEDDKENMTTGDLFPWPHEMRPAYVIFDKYTNINDIIWPGKNLYQAWEGVLE
ncbi:hypothetical protein NHQ30_007394 [Ciborinia camelliae]|nr:hypothetical protein NHQ30_007394 [Ciborinia camelliae]